MKEKPVPIIVALGTYDEKNPEKQVIRYNGVPEYKPFLRVNDETLIEHVMNELRGIDNQKLGGIYCFTRTQEESTIGLEGGNFGATNYSNLDIELKLNPGKRTSYVLPEQNHMIKNFILGYFFNLRDNYDLSFPYEKFEDIDWNHVWEQFDANTSLKETGFYGVLGDLPWFIGDRFNDFTMSHANTNFSWLYVTKREHDETIMKLTERKDMSNYDYERNKMNFSGIKINGSVLPMVIPARFGNVFYFAPFKDTKNINEFIECMIESSIVFVDNRHIIGEPDKYEKVGRILDALSKLRKTRKSARKIRREKEEGSLSQLVKRYNITSTMLTGLRAWRSSKYSCSSDLSDKIKFWLMSPKKSLVEKRFHNAFGLDLEVLIMDDAFSLLYDIDTDKNYEFALEHADKFSEISRRD